MLVHKGKKLKADIVAGEVVDTELLIQRNKFPPEIKQTDENANIKGTMPESTGIVPDMLSIRMEQETSVLVVFDQLYSMKI